MYALRRNYWAYLEQLWLAMFFEVFGFFCHCSTPYLVLLLFQKIVDNAIQTQECRLIIFLIVIFRVLRTVCSYLGELKLS